MFMNVHWPTVGASVVILAVILLVLYIGSKPKAQSTNYNYPGTM